MADGGLTLIARDPADVTTPASGKVTIFPDSTNADTPSFKDDTGTTTSFAGGTGPAGASAFPLEPIAHGNMGATETFDFGAGPVVAGVSGPFHTATMDMDCTITLATSTTTDQAILEIWLSGDGTPRTLTWDPDIDWEGGVTPTLDYTSGVINRLFFETVDGTNWLGSGPVAASGIPATIVDAKGDLIAATAADTVARLPVISGNGSSLIVASGESTGLKWQLNKYDATVAPTVNEDSGDGYSVGSIWIDVTGDDAYICVDASSGAAVWLPFDAGGGESWEGTWSAGTYTTGQIVEHDGVIYQANTTTTDEPPTADWDTLYTCSGGGSGYVAAITAETDVIHYWPLNEASGTTFADAIGADDLTVTVGTVGVGGPSLTKDFTNGGDLALINGARVARSGLTWPAAWSIEAWFFFANAAADVWLMGQWNGAGAMVYLTTVPDVRLYSGGTFATWSASTADRYGLHYVVLTHDGTTERLWWDAVNVASQTIGSPTTTDGGAFGLMLGGGGQQACNVSDFAYYDVALSGTVIGDHYTLGTT